MTTLTNQIWNDAGLLREYTAERFGSYFTGFFVFADTAERAMRFARRIAKLSGTSLEQVCRDIASDFEARD